jgi:hypothetical protein
MRRRGGGIPCGFFHPTARGDICGGADIRGVHILLVREYTLRKHIMTK